MRTIDKLREKLFQRLKDKPWDEINTTFKSGALNQSGLDRILKYRFEKWRGASTAAITQATNDKLLSTDELSKIYQYKEDHSDKYSTLTVNQYENKTPEEITGALWRGEITKKEYELINRNRFFTWW